MLSEDPFNSNDRTSAASSSTAAPSLVPHTDVNVVPVAGGTTEIGFGGGAFIGITRSVEGVQPYIWNLEAVGIATFKYDDKLMVPFQDAYAKLTIPRLFGKAPFRLELRPSYTWETTIKYYGLGNASPYGEANGADPKQFQYERLHPSMDAVVRWPIRDHIGAKVGILYTYNRLDVAPNSSLGQDIQSTNANVRKLLNLDTSHSTIQFKYGLQIDTRDSEVSSHSGMFHEAQIKLSPGGHGEFPYRYGQANVNMRFFGTIAKRWLTVAVRAVGDVLVGDPPFYELARYDDTYAVGGPNGVRGVPVQRYYGKIKAFGNFEVRSELIHFRLMHKEMMLGPIAFIDAGRVWADTAYRPELDGKGIGIHYGAGGGLRFQSGDAFVIRADVGWSPEAVAGYFGAGQNF